MPYQTDEYEDRKGEQSLQSLFKSLRYGMGVVFYPYAVLGIGLLWWCRVMSKEVTYLSAARMVLPLVYAVLCVIAYGWMASKRKYLNIAMGCMLICFLGQLASQSSGQVDVQGIWGFLHNSCFHIGVICIGYHMVEIFGELGRPKPKKRTKIYLWCYGVAAAVYLISQGCSLSLSPCRGLRADRATAILVIHDGDLLLVFRDPFNHAPCSLEMAEA